MIYCCNGFGFTRHIFSRNRVACMISDSANYPPPKGGELVRLPVFPEGD